MGALKLQTVYQQVRHQGVEQKIKFLFLTLFVRTFKGTETFALSRRKQRGQVDPRQTYFGRTMTILGIHAPLLLPCKPESGENVTVYNL